VAEPGEVTGPGGVAEPGEVTGPGGVAEPGEVTGPKGVAEPGFQDSQRDEGLRAHRESGHQPGRVGPRDSSGDGSASPGADEPATSPAGGSPAGASAADSEFRTIDEIRTIDVARADAGDRYRPWFAADEPGTPWFIE
jgi:hypothetical protein